MTDSRPTARQRGRASRISISLGDAVMEQLQALAEREGRSLSNLCARLLERAVQAEHSID